MLLFSSCFCSDFFILVSWNICTISHYFMCILHLLASWTCLIIKYCYIITQTWLKVCFLNHFSPSAWNNEYVLFSRVGLGATVRFPVASRGGHGSSCGNNLSACGVRLRIYLTPSQYCDGSLEHWAPFIRIYVIFSLIVFVFCPSVSDFIVCRIVVLSLPVYLCVFTPACF